MNNRETQSAAEPGAAETFVVDLTTVCLRSGTVRLPLSLIGRFSEGQHKVTAGGEELMIEFEAPRTLIGLAPFFERAELKANDRVRFVFDGQKLELTAQKRERARGSSRTGNALQAGPAGASGAQEPSPAQGRSEGRLTARGLFPAPAELVDSTNARPGEPAAQAEGEQAEMDAQAESDQWRDTSVKAVRRVRIEGGVAPRMDTAPPRPLDRASARDVWARRQQASWRSLDAMVAGPVVPPEEAAEAFSETTVRVVRRSKGTSLPLDVEAPPLPKPEPEAPSESRRPESYSMSWPLPESRRSAPSARPADGPSSRAPAPEAQLEEREERQTEFGRAVLSARADLDPYLDAPIDADRESGYVPPTILESDLLSLPPSGPWREESEEAYQKYKEAQLASGTAAAPVERRQGILGRLGLGRGARSGSASDAGSSDMGSSDAGSSARRSEQASKPVAPADRMTSGAPRESARSAQAISVETAVEVPAATPRRRADDMKAEAAPAAEAQRTQKAVIVDESVYDVDFDTDVQPHLQGAQEADGIEADMAKVSQYLHQPDVPAIVRCEDLAERLQMSQERVSSAMSRLAEDRERYTPLRGDAYMVRRVR